MVFMKYTTQHAQALFNVSHTTIKNWCAEFADYLSPSARPEPGHQRQFMEDDLRVLALVAEMKNRAATFDDIHAALKIGQRGVLPNSFNTALAPTSTIVAAISELREQIELMNSTIQNLQAEGNKKDGQITLLKEQLSEAKADIRRLERENARLSDHD